MRYIKSFNEDISKLKELESFCKMYLAELVDVGCSITIEISAYNNLFTVSIFNRDMPSWDVIKDTFIPFLHMLDREYDIVSDILFKGSHSNLIGKYSIEKLLSGDLDYDLNDDWDITRILFNVNCN